MKEVPVKPPRAVVEDVLVMVVKASIGMLELKDKGEKEEEPP